MDLLSPEPGLVIWSGLTFLVVLAVLTKFAWKPLLGMVKEREDKISAALDKAEATQQAYARMEEDKARQEAETRQEREAILKEARALKDQIVDEARQAAKAEADKILVEARAQIAKEKSGAIDELKQQVAKLSVEIAGKLIGSELQAEGNQEKLIEKYLQESNFN